MNKKLFWGVLIVIVTLMILLWMDYEAGYYDVDRNFDGVVDLRDRVG